MKFLMVAEAFDEIEKISSRLQITEHLAKLFAASNSSEASIITNLSLGTLYPPYKDSSFNIAEKTIISVIAQLLDRSVEDVAQEVKKAGDMGLVVALGDWDNAARELSVTDVFNRLVALQKISGTGSVDEKISNLQELLRSVDPVSAKFIVRIVLGKLRLGFSDMTIIDALSWMAVGDKSQRTIIEDAYNTCADLGYIAQVLKKDGIAALEQLSITMGIPIRPAAAERLPTARAIIEKLGPCIAQPKLDGFRLQIHLDNTGPKPIIHFFSRNLKDMSAMFPDLVQALTSLKVKTLICEGEAICYDVNTDSFLPFQETVKRKRKHGIDEAASEFPLKLFLFDLLYLNGTSLLSMPHDERYALLQSIVPVDFNSPLQFITEKQVTTAKELEDYFYEVIAEGLEGLVVKRPNAIYQPGKRNFNWIKLKRQEEGSVEDTIDCVILGYYAGEGKRAGFGIGAFLVGVFNKNSDQFQTVAKVGTGMTDEQWIALKKKCDAIKARTKPHNVVCAKELFPDVWVNPEIVCLIRADEITRSPLHTANKTSDHLGLALRFPRFMGYRDDKGATEATTDHELKEMFDHQKMR